MKTVISPMLSRLHRPLESRAPFPTPKEAGAQKSISGNNGGLFS